MRKKIGRRHSTDTVESALRLRPVRDRGIGLGLGLVFIYAAATISAAQSPEQAGADHFESLVRPVLVEHCYKCHSAEAKSLKGGLRLDGMAEMRQRGRYGPGGRARRPRRQPACQSRGATMMKNCGCLPRESSNPPRSTRSPIGSSTARLCRPLPDPVQPKSRQGRTSSPHVGTGPINRFTRRRSRRFVMEAGLDRQSIPSSWPESRPPGSLLRRLPTAGPCFVAFTSTSWDCHRQPKKWRRLNATRRRTRSHASWIVYWRLHIMESDGAVIGWMSRDTPIPRTAS